jgi:hypothetical protein
MATKRVLNCTTGEAVTVDLTPEEEAQRTLDAQASAAAQAAREAADTERTAATTDLASQYAAAVALLDSIADDPTTTDTAAKVRQATRDLARVQRRMLRLLKAALT